MTELEREISRLEYQLEHQELSAQDVERMQTELRQANASLDQVERENQALDQEAWGEERSIAKKQEEVEYSIFLQVYWDFCVLLTLYAQHWFHKRCYMQQLRATLWKCLIWT